MAARSRRRRAGVRSPAVAWALLAAAAGLVFLLGLLVGSRLGRPPVAPGEEGGAGAPATARPGPREPPGTPPRRATPRPPTEQGGAPRTVPAPAPRIALVIDDLGRSLKDLDELARLGIPISYAVLPYESRTGEVVEALNRRGAEILCHLPMQPRNGANPGPGALTVDMSPGEIGEAARQALSRVPGAVGVNNHMGSGLSAEPTAMRAVLGVVADEGLFYLDSRTTADSLGFAIARAIGLPAAERQVFLDPEEQSPSEVHHQFHRLLKLADVRGSAIAIGHPHPVTFRVLRQEVPVALAAGYRFVLVSELLETGPADAG